MTPDFELSTLPNGDTLLTVPTPAKQKCDFCRARPVVASYPCLDFGFEDANFYSRGAWAACQHCRKLVDGRHWDCLATFVAACEADSIADIPELTEFLRMVYQVFSQLRMGPAQEVTL